MTDETKKSKKATEGEKAYLALDPEGKLPTLGEWVVLNEAAEILGVTRQYFYTLVKEYNWRTLHRIGNSRTVVVHKSEVMRFKAERDLKAARDSKAAQKGDSSE